MQRGTNGFMVHRHKNEPGARDDFSFLHKEFETIGKGSGSQILNFFKDQTMKEGLLLL